MRRSGTFTVRAEIARRLTIGRTLKEGKKAAAAGWRNACVCTVDRSRLLTGGLAGVPRPTSRKLSLNLFASNPGRPKDGGVECFRRSRISPLEREMQWKAYRYAEALDYHAH